MATADGCLLELVLDLGGCGFVVAMVVVLDFWSPGLLAVGDREEAAADFLLCKGGLVALALVFDLTLFRTDGALACRDSFVGTALGLVALTFGLAAAALVDVFSGETTAPI